MMITISLTNPNILAENQMSDAGTVVECARKGDDEAFRLIFEQHHRLVIKFIYGMVGNLTLAEELTQETFLNAYRSLANYRHEGKLSSWLCGIARNVVRNSRRAEPRKLAADLDEHVAENIRDDRAVTPEVQLLDAELKKVVGEALQSLDEDKRVVFTLKVLRQLSYEEISAVTGSSIPKLKTDLHRARLEMRRMISPYLEGNHEM